MQPSTLPHGNNVKLIRSYFDFANAKQAMDEIKELDKPTRQELGDLIRVEIDAGRHPAPK